MAKKVEEWEFGRQRYTKIEKELARVFHFISIDCLEESTNIIIPNKVSKISLQKIAQT